MKFRTAMLITAAVVGAAVVGTPMVASATYNGEGGPLSRASLLPGSFGQQSLNLTGDVGFNSSFASCAPENSNGVNDSASFTIELNMWKPVEGHSYSFDLGDIGCLADLGITDPAIPVDPNSARLQPWDISANGSVINLTYHSGAPTALVGPKWYIPGTAESAGIVGYLSVNAWYAQCPGQPGPIVEGVAQPVTTPLSRFFKSDADAQAYVFAADELRGGTSWASGNVTSLVPVLFGSTSVGGEADTMVQNADHSISVKPNQVGGQQFDYCLVDPVSLTSARASGTYGIDAIQVPAISTPNDATPAPALAETGADPALAVVALALTVLGVIALLVGRRRRNDQASE